MSDRELIGVQLAAQAATIAILSVLIYVGWRLYPMVSKVREFLVIAKAWYEIGRTQHKDAGWERQQAGAAAVAAANTAAKVATDVKRAVAAVPDATAAKVVEALEHKAGDSGVFGPIRPPDTKGT